VEEELTHRETDLHEVIYLKLYESQVPVFDQTLENRWGPTNLAATAWKLICADFLAGTKVDNM
jgi:hypothetical protein